MKIDDMFPHKFTAGADLVGPTPVTITKLTQESMHPRPNAAAEDKWILHTRELSRPVILTRALATGIAAILGPDTDRWPNHKVTLVPVPMMVAQRQVVAIRATGPTAAPAPVQAPPQPAAAPAPQPAIANGKPPDLATIAAAAKTLLANGRTGEIPGPVPALKYQDGRHVDEGNRAEYQAYNAYLLATSRTPASLAALRQWVRDTPKVGK